MKQKEISKTIKQLRLENNMDQETLGKLVRVSRQTVSNWENGKTIPTTENIFALSKIFHTTPIIFSLELDQEELDRLLEEQEKFKYRNIKQECLVLNIFLILEIVAMFILLFIAGYFFGFQSAMQSAIYNMDRFWCTMMFVGVVIAFIIPTIVAMLKRR